MLKLKTPNGLAAEVPESPAEDITPHFVPSDTSSIRDYYAANGYVVVSGLIDISVCDTMRALWDAEIRPYRGSIYRQGTAKLERHRLNRNGWVMNPILNLQSLDPALFPGTRAHARNKLLTAPRLTDILEALLGERPKIVQSMYFEGNSATWEHQDSYYLDSEQAGTMAGAWIALEDISPAAGRFFVCPGSHRHRAMHSVQNSIVTNHDGYIRSIMAEMRATNAEVRAPALRKGDVLFWNSFTVHGSLDSSDREHSRSSVTCHAIPASHRLMQFHSRLSTPAVQRVNGAEIFAPKDMASLHNRLIAAVEARFPRQFHALKRAAIEHVLARRVS